MGKLTNILIHPAFIALLITVAAVASMQGYFSKYRVELVRQQPFEKDLQVRFLYHDFDHDGASEKVHAGLNSYSKVPFIDFSDSEEKLIGEWNCPGTWVRHAPLLFGDCNGNGRDEVYGFTIQNDTLFLNGIEPFGNWDFEVRRMFITALPRYDGQLVCRVLNGKVTDLDGDGYPEAVFALNGGFGPQPRGVFAADIRRDTVLRSPFMGTSITALVFANIDEDPQEEIIVNTYAPANYKEPVPWTDTCSWAMVLDNDLDFLFPPVRMDGKYSGTAGACLRDGEGGRVLSHHISYHASPETNRLMLFDLSGKRLHEQALDPSLKGINMVHTPGSAPLFVHGKELYGLKEDLSLKKAGSLKDPVASLPRLIDLDQDSIPELLFTSGDRTKLLIYRNDLSHPVVLDHKPFEFSTITSRWSKNSPGLFCITDEETSTWYVYARNPAYRLRFPAYFLLFLLLWGFFHLLFLLQRRRINKIYETERRINELQMLTIRNQMNPHFTFNALNSISSVIFKEDRKAAYNFFTKFSNLIRFTLKNAEHITVPLSEELEFVRNYLDLEKFRFKELFDYTIHEGPGVDETTAVPRMILQTFAENAVKHGLSQLGRGGMLKIGIEQEHRTLVLTIEDNGIGRMAAAEKGTQGTGRGMHIIDQIFDLYHKLKGKRITHTVTDLVDADGKAAGTRVEVRMEI